MRIPPLAWADCGEGGYQCTPAQVPLDYHRPAGTQLTLQLPRWQAVDPAARIGTLFRYAGGPAPTAAGLGNTGDPNTPYADSVSLARILANGHLLTWASEGHTARRQSARAEAYMYEYLLRVTVPPAGTVCRDAPMPA